MPSLVVLAGGEARRLGSPKHSLAFQGETLLERMLRRLGPLCYDRIVVARSGQDLQVPETTTVYDEVPSGGALSGVAAGLAASQRDWALVVACDLPFVNRALVGHMLGMRADTDLVIPRLDVGDEPLHALYHRRCLPAIRRALARGNRRLNSFHDDIRVRYVLPDVWQRFDPSGTTFFNINTPEDLARAVAISEGDTGRPS